MKYTRYNMSSPRKSSNNSFLVILLCTLLLAFLVGTIVFKVFFKEHSIGNLFPGIEGSQISEKLNGKDYKNGNGVESKEESKEGEIKGTSTTFEEPNVEKVEVDNGKNKKAALLGETVKFYAVQCGVFKNQDNAHTLKEELMPYGNPFIVKETEYDRVILGIYNEEDIQNIIDGLNDNGFETNKVIFEISYEGLCNKEISELIRANLKVLKPLSQSDVSAVETKQVKEWMASLQNVNEDDENYKELTTIKEHTSNLPVKLTGKDASSAYKFIYNYLNNK